MNDQSPNPTGGTGRSRRADLWRQARDGLVAGFARLKGAAQKDREVHYTCEDQLTMAGIAHGVILVGVWLIVEKAFSGGSTGHVLKYFYICEGAIVALGFLATISTRQIVSAFDKGSVELDSVEEWMNDNPSLKMQVQKGVLGLMFVLQFVSMALLLEATGGPIDSPFAPMALGIGVFTPLILNKRGTVFVVIIGTMVFYGLLTGIVGFGGAGNLPDPSAYATVNLFILASASFLTLRRRDAFSFKLRKIVKAKPERVWEAWTETGQVGSWIGDEPAPGISLDVREGGQWEVTLPGRDGREPSRWFGTYREVEKPKKLVFSIAARSGIGEEVISVELKQQGEVTQMVLVQTDEGRFEGLKRGWTGFVDQLSGYVMTPAGRRPNGKSDG